MNKRIDKVEQQIADLEHRQLLLTACANLAPFEKAELSLLPAKLARLEDYRNTLIAALAPTLGSFELKCL
jgi:hypothetical protein